MEPAIVDFTHIFVFLLVNFILEQRYKNNSKFIIQNHYPGLRTPVGGLASFPFSLGIAKASFVSAPASPSNLIEEN
ncbi:MAG: hypothetical protein IKP54_07885 [Bacteroidales bacterium]|nr:hypothetical protein [Bacteroidales bacterium]